MAWYLIKHRNFTVTLPYSILHIFHQRPDLVSPHLRYVFLLRHATLTITVRNKVICENEIIFR